MDSNDPMSSTRSTGEAPVLEAQTIPDLVAPHVAGADPVDYRIVIPTRGRWRPASEISSERKLSQVSKPFILVKTLTFLKRQGISPCKVTLWTADAEEAQHYRSALQQDEYWSEVACQIGVPGIRSQRNHIALAYEESSYIISLDDDVGDVLWKQYAGNRSKLVSLPRGGFEKLVRHAYACMKKHKAFIWGLATTVRKNRMSLHIDGISTRNGEINGFFYGFINRHDDGILPQVEDATEDAERSLRYFAKDKIVLRYRMYCCETRCWEEQGGLQALMGSNTARRDAERRGAAQLHSMFPGQTLSPKEGQSKVTLSVKFRSLGTFVLPTTSAAVLTAANELERATREVEAQTSTRKKRPAGVTVNIEAVSSTPTPSRSRSPHEQLKPTRSVRENFNNSLVWEGASDNDEEASDPENDAAANGENEIDEVEDENSQFESFVASSLRETKPLEQSSHGEDELIRRAMEVSMQDLDFKVLLFNGEGAFNDHMERALNESRAAAREEEERALHLRHLLEQEEEELSRVKRLSTLDSGLHDADSCSPADKKQRVDVGDASLDAVNFSRDGANVLVDMGFSRTDSEKEFANAGGNVEIALERLLSRGRSLASITVESQD